MIDPTLRANCIFTVLLRGIPEIFRIFRLLPTIAAGYPAQGLREQNPQSPEPQNLVAQLLAAQLSRSLQGMISVVLHGVILGSCLLSLHEGLLINHVSVADTSEVQ